MLDCWMISISIIYLRVFFPINHCQLLRKVGDQTVASLANSRWVAIKSGPIPPTRPRSCRPPTAGRPNGQKQNGEEFRPEKTSFFLYGYNETIRFFGMRCWIYQNTCEKKKRCWTLSCVCFCVFTSPHPHSDDVFVLESWLSIQGFPILMVSWPTTSSTMSTIMNYRSNNYKQLLYIR